MVSAQLLPGLLPKLRHMRRAHTPTCVEWWQARGDQNGGKPNLHVSLAPGCWPQPQGCRRCRVGFHGQSKFSSLWLEHEAYGLDLLSVVPQRWASETASLRNQRGGRGKEEWETDRQDEWENHSTCFSVGSTQLQQRAACVIRSTWSIINNWTNSEGLQEARVWINTDRIL